ncbi:14353_t:CDS:2, partial [Cetraspora pellucida]
MEFNLVLNEDTTSSANAPLLIMKRTSLIVLMLRLIDSFKKQKLEMRGTNKDGQETQYGECHIMNDGNIQRAQRIKMWVDQLRTLFIIFLQIMESR